MSTHSPPSNSQHLRGKLALITGAGLVALSRAAIAARVRRRPDGWRRAAGLVLRGDNAKFVLSAFGLDVWSDVQGPHEHDAAATQAHLAERLIDSLARAPELLVRIRRAADEHRAEASDRLACTLRFDAWEPGPARFVPPVNWDGGEHPAPSSDDTADVLFSIICRIAPSGHADLWVRANHVGTDGVPVQEALSRLEMEWGTNDVAYPSPHDFAPLATPRPAPGRPHHAQLQSFVDFGPLLAWRKQENAHLPEPMTFSAAVLWWLAQQPPLEGRYMGTTVEVAATSSLPRGVGVVVTRPSEFLRRPDGLARYVHDFNAQMDRTRRRASSSCKALDAAVLLPARSAEALLRHALDHQPRAFGTVALTVLKDARVFGTPIGDTGHPDGFLAIGSAALPTGGGQRVGCVTVKGPATRLREYPRILEELGRAGEQAENRQPPPSRPTGH